VKKKPRVDVPPAAEQRQRIEYMELGVLLKFPKNPRGHDFVALGEAFKDRGFVTPLLLDETSGLLVEGHGRLEKLEEMRAAGAPPPARIEDRDGKWSVPVVRGVYFENMDQARRHLLGANRIGEGLWDNRLTADMLGKLGEGNLIGSGFGEKDLVTFLARAGGAPGEGATDPNAVPERPKKARSKTGDLWILGEHRLLCGDSTVAADVKRLMGSDRAAMMATDPPYGVDYTDEQRVGAAKQVDGGKRKQIWKVSIDNDDKTGADIQPFLEAVFAASLQHALAPNAAWYLWHAHMTQGFFAAAAAAAANLVLHRQIIWVKPGMLLGFGDYHWRHELCFYGWVKGSRPPFYGDRNQTTVWEVSNETAAAKRVHPTQKPVEIFERPMNNHVKRGGVCYEPFSGSGTQIIAGERLGRRVLAMEKDPAYVDVAVQRWEEFTKLKAKLQK